MMTKPAPRGNYIPASLAQHCLNGDAYVPMAESYRICCGEKSGISFSIFQNDLTEQFGLGCITREGTRLYLTRTLRYEESAASHLAAILLSNEVDPPTIPDELKVGELTLVPEQRQAVRFALSHRLSIILGGAGSGKTTLIRAIAAQYGNESRRVLCAPTGKAARNLTERTGCVARTIHSALGMHPNDDFLSPVIWENVGLVIVDEASMASLEMLAGILCTVREDCRIVLLGDCNQLLSVGSGSRTAPASPRSGGAAPLTRAPPAVPPSPSPYRHRSLPESSLRFHSSRAYSTLQLLSICSLIYTGAKDAARTDQSGRPLLLAVRSVRRAGAFLGAMPFPDAPLPLLVAVIAGSHGPPTEHSHLSLLPHQCRQLSGGRGKELRHRLGP